MVIVLVTFASMKWGGTKPDSLTGSHRSSTPPAFPVSPARGGSQSPLLHIGRLAQLHNRVGRLAARLANFRVPEEAAANREFFFRVTRCPPLSGGAYPPSRYAPTHRGWNACQLYLPKTPVNEGIAVSLFVSGACRRAIVRRTTSAD